MAILEIVDKGCAELNMFTKATEAQLMHWNEPEKYGYFVTESAYVTGLALDSGYEPICALAERSVLSDKIIERLGDIPIYTGDKETVKEVTGFNMPFGILCVMKRKAQETADEICKASSRIALLERVMNPANVGAIARSAAALGFDALLLSSDCSDPLYRRAARVSMGTVFKIPWAVMEKDEPYKNIEFLKAQGFTTVAMALTDSTVDIDHPALESCEKLAVVLGSEGDGLTKESIAACDYTVKIPMKRGVDSLNVAAASAVAFWQLRKK